MNIKKLISSQRIRHKILKCLFWVPDKVMVSIQYWLILKRLPNLKNPKRFTEWIQWYKIHYRNPLILICADKSSVRTFISETIGTQYLTKLYGEYIDASEIKFNNLPSKFVIKTSDGGNGDNILICHDKSKLKIKETISLINRWRGKKIELIGREWAYKGCKQSKILIEEYLEKEDKSELEDYKFFCFNGDVKYCQLISNRFTDEKIDFYNVNWEKLEGVVGLNPIVQNSNINHPRPKNYEQMVEIAKTLSQSFPFVRVDMYNINGRIVFGELTFYPSSGYGRFKPDSFDFELGSLFANSIANNNQFITSK